MDYFNYQHNELFAEEVSLRDIAQEWGTPCYVYSRKTLERHWHVFDDALKGHAHRICYAVKANSNLALLNVLAQLGSGFDIVSGGELERVLRAGGDPKKVIFSGVGKQPWEIRAALAAGIGCFNVESIAECDMLESIAIEMNKQAPVALRINPHVDAKTHPYISTGLRDNKFGIAIEKALPLYERIHTMSHLKIEGVACHIGSQLLELSPFIEALNALQALIKQLMDRGITINQLDLGGGLGVPYGDETPPSPFDYAQAIAEQLTLHDVNIILEPGRAIAANAGILLVKVQLLKHTDHKHFAIVDGAMNDLLRPALYSAWHDIVPVLSHGRGKLHTYDIVGPVCETSDFLGKDREMALSPGDLLAVRTAGAYGFVMSSNYNTRPRGAEIMVDGQQAYCIRERESLDDLLAKEHMLPIA
ncbi:MAG: diaminopimelate decarboxylase [Gammaproteobacteria bacterium]